MATSQMRVLSKNKEPRKADALREHSIVKMRQRKSEAKAAQPEEAAGVRLVVQLHGQADQLLPALDAGRVVPLQPPHDPLAVFDGHDSTPFCVLQWHYNTGNAMVAIPVL